MEQLFSLDYINFILPLRTDWLTAIMKGFSFLGDEEFFILVIPVSFWLWNKSILAKTGVIMFFSIFFNAWIKNFFEIPRPLIEHLVTTDLNDWSFPSGHAHYSTVVWGWMAYEWKKQTTNLNLKKYIYPLFMAIILAIGFSRIYLGVHYPVDVLAGFTLGYLTLVGYYYLTTAENKKWHSLSSFIQSVILFLSIIALFLIPHTLTEAEIKGAAVFLGFAIGVIYEKKYLDFHYDWNQSRVVKAKSIIGSLVVGYVGLVIVWIGLKEVFLMVNFFPEIADFVRYLLMGLWVGVVGPGVFCWMGFCRRVVV